MPGTPFFSVIIPTYNRLPALKQLLACLSQQEAPTDDFEVIIIDDGSQDGTLEYLQAWSAAGKGRFAVQAHQGPGAARNLGAHMARGELLAFTDSDCLPEPGWLSELARCFTKSVEIQAIGGRIQNIDHGNWLHQFQAVRGTDHTANHQPDPLYLDTANAALRREAFLAVGGFNPAYTWSEDVDLGFRLRHSGIPLSTTQQAVVWHVGADSLPDYLRRQVRIGLGTSRLRRDYPAVFNPPPSGKLRRKIWNALECLPQRTDSPKNSWEKLRMLLARALYTQAQWLVSEKVFFCYALPRQIQLYRHRHVKPLWLCAYFGLEWLCHLAFSFGLIQGTWHLLAPASHHAPPTSLVSVIIPTFNRADLLPRAIRSVLAQAGVPVEIIVVDDASTDATQQVLQALNCPQLHCLRHQTRLWRGCRPQYWHPCQPGKFDRLFGQR